MKIKNLLPLLLGFVFYFIFIGVIFPWDNHTSHPSFNEAILELFEFNYISFFPSEYDIKISQGQQKYKGMAVTQGALLEKDYAEDEMEYTISEWIKHGGYSADEPEAAAAVRHFYDPIGLSYGHKYLTNRGTYWEDFYFNPQIDAIGWALYHGDNKWNLSKGKNYFIKALEEKNINTKNENLAKAFRCLGEVLHNTADMGCPAHVRNDSHASILWEARNIFGSPDATEELFTANGYVSKYMDNEADQDLEKFFNNATTIQSIHEKLAEFTNANFFTTQTMNGTGIEPINSDGNYPQPLLHELEYSSTDQAYYKTFSNGNRIKMASDDGYFWHKSYPYIYQDCVNSQASLLVPNIIWAGINVVRLFIPKLEVSINSANKQGELTGIVKHIPENEYLSEIKYSGKMFIYDSKSTEKLGEIDCSSGDFSGKITNIQNSSEIYAALEIAGITIKSESINISDVNFTKCIVGVQVVGEIRKDIDGTISTSTETVTFGSYMLDGGFYGNTFSGSIVNVLITFNSAKDTIKTLNFTSANDDKNTGGFVHKGFNAINIPITDNEDEYKLIGMNTFDGIKVIYSESDNGGIASSKLTNHSCDENSYLSVNFYE